MASVGPEAYSLGLKRGNQFQVGIAPGLTVPPLTAKLHESKAWYLAKQQVKPIWQLEQKHVTNFQDLQSVHSGISSQRPRLLYPESLCSDTAFLTSPPPLPHALPNFLGSTLLYRRSYFRHKPYRRLESICLQPTSLEKKPLCAPLPAYRSVLNNTMTSSAIDPFFMPNTAADCSNPVSKGFPLSSGKQNSNSYRPVLNNNSFLRPTSAKVPLQQQYHQPLPPENKKLKGLSRPIGFSWTHSGGNGDGAPANLERKLGKNSGITLEQPSAKSPRSAIHNGVVLKVERPSWRLEDGENRSQNLKEQDVRLTEAMRKLTANGIRKVSTYNEFGHRIDSSCLMNANFHSSLFNRWKPHIVAQITPKDVPAATSPNLEPGSRHQSLMVTEAADVCTKRIDVRFLASNPEPSNHCALSQTVNHTSVNTGEQVVKTELSPRTTVSEVETKISSLQLGTDTKWGSPITVKETEAAVNLPLLDQAEVEDVEEELPDGLEDACSQDEEGEEEDGEGESDGSSSSGLSPNGSVAIISRNCVEGLVPTLEGQERILKPALTCSLFPNVPPTIYFGTRDERVEKLPWEQRKMLRWKMSTVTPNIVKATISRSHFKISKRNNDWLGCWGHHMKSPGFRVIREHQKLNHFPGSFQIGRKDRLWRNVSKMQLRFGKKEFNFLPQSFILPQDIKLLRKAWEDCGSRQKWIVKPPASARGIGIQVIHKWSQLPKRRPLLVQRYLHKPYLIGGSKFDLRIYVYVTCYDPLRVYLFKDGLVRFASCKYSPSVKSLNNKYMHLTNYSINKKNIEYKANTDETACQGHKWALKALWSYLAQKGVDSEAIWEKIKDIVVKTIIASEPYIINLVKMYVRRPYCCHELFGFDIMLDENLKPWILEVNISPSLHSNSPLDVSIKGQMVRDALNLAGFLLPSTDDVASPSGSASSSTTSLNSVAKEKSKSSLELFTSEKTKRAFYLTSKVPDQEFYSTILDVLTPDDVRVLVETEDEFARRGQFERVFPSRFSMHYLRFFEQPRYYNILTSQWELKYFVNKVKGVDLLRNWCHKGFHNGVVTESTVMWSIPRSHLYLKNELPVNGLSKMELGRTSKILVQRDGEEPVRSSEPNPCTQSLPQIKYTAGSLKKPTIPRTLSNSSLVK
ncbi:tubulin monoglutamylase TTLL4 isoform X1 [Podarcis raffonei]|uniref:tubulin monoglutamylase TTLL4 isoform X1 n=1 Tax=Podarcis raffonei TaxID=65483 RepID=UPI002329182F|nr:tubulin monoglutamylase TTLL4 isoform X1 [Podarcis raffonei]XP_053257455.1 tubulin monoglutamylase TTLL4 isoform X1 [Podarcis raffonei]XP_053257461.1 tubulin monoglutamylase TTLL4 isoform X1 [Podarcis raffonei]XP_053257470.1 tubulin monoglutamylase TTLL4 isoform X1 [Podarcis raffonei]XP_053257477.1 tubulin monoglutamylase TTLL4 isoform X1 [Podarcis raffonei]